MTVDTHKDMGWLSLSSSCVRAKGVLGAEEARIGMKTVTTAARRQWWLQHDDSDDYSAQQHTGSSQQLTIALCISHMYIYMYKHMYITHLAALSPSCSFQRLIRHPAAFPSAWDTQTKTEYKYDVNNHVFYTYTSHSQQFVRTSD